MNSKFLGVVFMALFAPVLTACVVVRFTVAAFICGFVWETWNYYSVTKWVYDVPWVYRFHVWEMPFVGYAAYLPFGLECVAVAAWLNAGLVGWREGNRRHFIQ